MPPKGGRRKNKGAAQPLTPKRKAKKAATKTITMLGNFEEPQNLPGPSGQASAMMDVLMDISQDSHDDRYEFDTVPTATTNVSEVVRERVMRCMWQVPSWPARLRGGLQLRDTGALLSY